MAIHDLNLAARYSDTLVMLKNGMVHAVGDPLSLLTKENIRAIFGVEAVVMRNLDRPYVVPIRSLNGEAPEAEAGQKKRDARASEDRSLLYLRLRAPLGQEGFCRLCHPRRRARFSEGHEMGFAHANQTTSYLVINFSLNCYMISTMA